MEELPSLTREMMAEEKEIEEINKAEGEAIRNKLEQKTAMDKEAAELRHKRLMHLLTKSEFYSQYLLKKIDEPSESDDNNNPRKRLKKGSMESKENSGLSNCSSQESSQGRSKRISRRSCVLSSLTNQAEENLRVKKTADEDRQRRPVEEQPFLLEHGILRPYQLEGFSWLRTLFENGINGILADEMGLGKTVQFIAMVCHLVHKGIVGPFLVVAPLSTLSNWIAEFKTFAPKVPMMLYHGSKDDRKKKFAVITKVARLKGTKLKCCPVVITSYQVAIRDNRNLKQIMWRYLAVDEGHRLKNHKCLLARSLCSLTSTNRVILTGTPLQNNLAELWSLLNFLLPDVFDSLDVFESWFEIEDMMEEGADERIVQQERERQIVSTLHRILNPFLLRRVKADVDLDIPAKRELLVYVPMTQLQLDLYRATLTRDLPALKGAETPEQNVEYSDHGRPRRSNKQRRNLAVLLDDSDSDEAFENFLTAAVKDPFHDTSGLAGKEQKKSELRINMRNIMMQCRRIVNHPYLLRYPLTPEGHYKIDGELLKQCGKLQVLDQLLEELHKRGHKVLLFSQMTKILDIIEDYLTLKPRFKYKRLDGRVSIEDRTSDISEFNKGRDQFLFLISTRAGGLGINLTAADTVIIYDSDWNPQQDLQAQDRCHRIGQTKPVLVLRLVSASTVDQKIVERAAAKRKLEKMIMKSGKFKSCYHEERNMEGLDPDQLLKLLQTRDHDRIHRASEGTGVLTKEELYQILDRSDLRKSTKETKELEGVFKTIETPLS